MLNYFYWVVTLLKRMIAQFKPYNTTRSRFKSPNQTTKRFFIEFFTEFLVSMLFVIIAILSRNSSVNVNFMEDSWFFSHGGEKVVLDNYVCSTVLFHHHFIKVQQAAYRNPRQYWTMKLASFWWIFWKIIVFLFKMQYKASFWQNQQATLHPFAVYHNDNNG